MQQNVRAKSGLMEYQQCHFLYHLSSVTRQLYLEPIYSKSTQQLSSMSKKINSLLKSLIPFVSISFKTQRYDWWKGILIGVQFQDAIIPIHHFTPIDRKTNITRILFCIRIPTPMINSWSIGSIGGAILLSSQYFLGVVPPSYKF